MDAFLVVILLAFMASNWNNVPGNRDIKQYFDKPYCEETKLGNETIKKCWKVVEDK